VTVRGNTVTANSVGIQCNPTEECVIANNNIYDNSQYNLRIESANDVDATGNWWGTTDQTTINQTIYDYKYDFNLGKVNTTPILTSPNPEAPDPAETPTPTPPTPTPTPSSSTTPTPSQNPQQTLPPEAIAGILIMVAVVAAALAFLLYIIKKK